MPVVNHEKSFARIHRRNLAAQGIVALTFARIHRLNLAAQGIVALTFADAADYAKAEVGQTWSFPALRDELDSGESEIRVHIEDLDETLALSHDFNPAEREILLCGGLLAHLRRADSAAQES
jgi:aconitate hydratase